MDGFGVAAVFAADAELEVRAGGAALVGADLHQSADAVGVDGFEGRDREDTLVQIGREDGGFDVVAGEPPGGLGEVVGAEGEEVGSFGDPVRGQRRPG